MLIAAEPENNLGTKKPVPGKAEEIKETKAVNALTNAMEAELTNPIAADRAVNSDDGQMAVRAAVDERTERNGRSEAQPLSMPTGCTTKDGLDDAYRRAMRQRRKNLLHDPDETKRVESNLAELLKEWRADKLQMLFDQWHNACSPVSSDEDED